MSKNDITGDEIKTKPSNNAYDKGYDLIFGDKNKIVIKQKDEVKQSLKTRLEAEEMKRRTKEQDCV